MESSAWRHILRLCTGSFSICEPVCLWIKYRHFHSNILSLSWPCFFSALLFFTAAVYFVKHVEKYRRKIICPKMRRRMPKCVCEEAAERSGRRAHIPTCVQISLFGKMIFIFIICSCYVFFTGAVLAFSLAAAHALALTFTISCSGILFIASMWQVFILLLIFFPVASFCATSMGTCVQRRSLLFCKSNTRTRRSDDAKIILPKNRMSPKQSAIAIGCDE